MSRRPLLRQLIVAVLVASIFSATLIYLTVVNPHLITKDSRNVTTKARRHIANLQLGPTHHLGSWRSPGEGEACSRPLKPAFYPYHSAADSVWTAPVLSFYVAAASNDSSAAAAALECVDEIGLPRNLIERIARRRKLRIALLGDSVDRNLADEYCKLTGSEIRCRSYNMCECDSRLLHIRNRWITGSNLDGPWPTTEPHVGPILPGIAKFLDANDTAAGGAGKWDIIVLNSMQWDLLRLHVDMPHVLEEVMLPQEFLQGWMRNVTQMMQHIQMVAPRAKHMWRTVAAVEGNFERISPPEHNQWFARPLINNQLAALNDAGRVVAAANGFIVHDVDMMTRQLHRDARLRDSNHPWGHIQMEVLNRILISYFLSMA